MSVLATIRRSVGLSGGEAKVDAPSTPRAQPPLPSSRQNSQVFAQLILENSNGQEKAAYPIRKRNTKIGRLPTNDIRIYRETVSRIHCQIVIDERGMAHLHVLNPRGVKVNDEDVSTEKDTTGSSGGGARMFALQQDDRIEIYRNFFRMHYSKSPSKNIGKQHTSTAAAPEVNSKSMRMSLVRASVLPVKAASPTQSAARSPLKDRRSGNVPQQRVQVAPSGSEAQPPRKGRRSLVFATPKREQQVTVPWTAEPTKRPQLAALDVSSAKQKKKKEEESVVVMEEVESQDEEEEQAAEGVEEQENIQQRKPLSLTPLTPQASTSSTVESDRQRLTQSASPTKRAKRRSSFFGRAGIFSNWNLGFYPEERKEQAEELNTAQLLTSPPPSNNMPILPEPPLDDEGNPRLPLSLSSPGGAYTSPKRRIVSLRTATLLRQGQHAYEQQKMRSPPASPSKQDESVETPVRSLMDAMKMIVSTSNNVIEQHACDADDEDEIDRSLSVAEEEHDADDERPKVFKLRTSESHATYLRTTAKPNVRKSRTSMPAKLVSITLVEGLQHSTYDIDDLRAQWLAEQDRDADAAGTDVDNVAAAYLSDHLEEHSDTDSELDESVAGRAKDEMMTAADVSTYDKENKVADVFESEPIPESDDDAASWQVVSPRRSRWIAEERSMHRARRASEISASRHTNDLGTKKIGKRRITAAPALATQMENRAVAAARADLQNNARPKVSRRMSHANATEQTPPPSKAKRRTTVAPTYSQTIDDTPISALEDRTNTNLIKFDKRNPVRQSGARRSELPNKTASHERLQRRTTAAASFMYNDAIAKEEEEQSNAEGGEASTSATALIAEETGDGTKMKDKPPTVMFLERKPINGRRLSDMPMEVAEPIKAAKLSRRTTAAASLASMPMPIATTARSPTKRGASPDSIPEAATQKARRSPTKRAKSTVAVEVAEAQESVRKPRAAKIAAVAAIQSSPTKPSRTTTTTTAPTTAASPIKKRLTTKSSKATLRQDHSEYSDDSSVPTSGLPTSSPTKQVKRLAKTNTKSTTSLTAGPSARIKATLAAKKAVASGNAAAEHDVEQDVAATAAAPARVTRSGRSVRKPTDMGQPITVVAKSDPVVPTAARTRARRIV